MAIQTIRFSHVHFTYPNQTQPLFSDLSITFSTGWTAILGANGSGKSTLLQLATGMLRPVLGDVQSSPTAWYLAQRTDELPVHYEDFAYAYDKEACKLHGLLALQRDWVYRWDTLSHGERKRAQLACALWHEPEVLAVDEPTNHLDRQAVQYIAQALTTYKGIGILVSHDRALADQLCTNTAMVHAPLIRMMHCIPSVAIDESSRISNHLGQAAQNDVQHMKHSSQELNVRASRAAQQDRLRLKRNIDKKDHDAKARIDRARVSGADGKAGRLKSQLEKRVARVERRVNNRIEDVKAAQLLDVKKPISGISLVSAPLKRDAILSLAAGSLPLGPERKLVYSAFEIGATDRIGITGVNGSGKSTVMRYIYRLLGEKNIPVSFVPQELDSDTCQETLVELNQLDSQTKGRVISSLTRLGSDPNLIQSSALASPGEAKKLLFSLLIEQPISVLFLDEPTNHLDLPARLALEQALSTYTGALVCISHDTAFLSALCTSRWDIIVREPGADSELTVEGSVDGFS